MDEPGGHTVLITGLPSAGKSTIAAGLAARLRGDGRRVEILDGDDVRRHLSADLGFSQADRTENARRIGYVAWLLSRNGIVTLVPMIAPYAASRHRVRDLHETNSVRYTEVFVDTPVAVCAARDVKGLYARQRSGELRGLTGVDDPYEPPLHPDLVLLAGVESEAESVSRLHDHLAAERNGGRVGRR